MEEFFRNVRSFDLELFLADCVIAEIHKTYYKVRGYAFRHEIGLRQQVGKIEEPVFMKIIIEVRIPAVKAVQYLTCRKL